MANTRSMRIAKRQPSMLQSIGNKVKNVAEFIGSAKGIWDTGRAIYGAVQAAAPYIGPVVAAVL